MEIEVFGVEDSGSLSTNMTKNPGKFNHITKILQNYVKISYYIIMNYNNMLILQ